MEKICFSLSVLMMVIGLSVTTTMAGTFTTSSGNVSFSVNDSGSFYVRNLPMPPGAGTPPGVNASSSISGSTFHLTAGGAGYSDAGIVLYFNGGFRLMDLQGVSVVSSGSSPMINLWFDTSGDGQFFQLNGSGLLTGLNGDSYGSGNSPSLNSTSLIYMQGGNGAGNAYTLAQLQAGVVPGINGNTLTSLWIGITNSSGGPADISSVTVSLTSPAAGVGGSTPVGYGPQWLIITLLSLTFSGGYLIRKRMARQ